MMMAVAVQWGMGMPHEEGKMMKGRAAIAIQPIKSVGAKIIL